MGTNLKVAVAAARSELVKRGRLTEMQAQNKTPQGLCNLLRLRYQDGSAPKGKGEKKQALLSWANTRNTIVQRSFMSEARHQMRQDYGHKHERDRKMMESATSRAIRRKQKTDPVGFKHANSEGFLESKEWKQLRKKVLDHYGSKCMVCGRTPQDGAIMNVDHIKPRKLYPSLALDFDNLGVLCGHHNKLKGNQDWGDYRQPGWKMPEAFRTLIRFEKKVSKQTTVTQISVHDLPEEQLAHLKSILG